MPQLGDEEPRHECARQGQRSITAAQLHWHERRRPQLMMTSLLPCCLSTCLILGGAPLAGGTPINMMAASAC